MCSCILIITQTFSNFSVFPVVLLFALKVCVPRVGSHRCNFQISSPLHLIHPSPCPSSVAVLHLFHIPAIKILHGFQCFVAVGCEAEEQASFRRFNPDQKLHDVQFLQKSSLNDTRRLDGIVCRMQQESSEINVQVWPVFKRTGPI